MGKGSNGMYNSAKTFSCSLQFFLSIYGPENKLFVSFEAFFPAYKQMSTYSNIVLLITKQAGYIGI